MTKSPKYHIIANDLRTRIQSGEFPMGSQLPAEQKLCSEYTVNRHTLRKAVQQLVDGNYLEKKRGVGTFVCPKRHVYNMGPSCQFSQTMLSKNSLQSQNVVLAAHEIVPLKEISEKLEIGEDEKVYMIKRLTKLGGVPYSITTSYFRARRFPHLTKFIKTRTSLSQIIREQYKVNQRRTNSTFSVTMAKQEHLNLLDIDQSTPILNVRNISRDTTDEVVEYNISDYRGDYASIAVEYQ